MPIACGSTREAVCPPCARKARVLRMQQCQEGWHRDTEPDRPVADQADDDQADDDDPGWGVAAGAVDPAAAGRAGPASGADGQPAPVGRTFATPDGKEYRPSMFLTLTLPSYGADPTGTGCRSTRARYDYRRAALDALHFPKLVDRFWQNLRRCAGYKVQYFAAIEPQRRLAPHLHAAIRGVIPRAVLRQVIEATYLQVWWPPLDQPVYVHRQPVWDRRRLLRPRHRRHAAHLGEALDQLDADPSERPAHVMRFGAQYDMAGIIALLTGCGPGRPLPGQVPHQGGRRPARRPATAPPAREAHIDRLHDELRWLPCSPRCANWLRYGIQPDSPDPASRRPLPSQGARPGTPRHRRPPRPGLPRLVRQDPRRAPSRPGHRRP